LHSVYSYHDGLFWRLQVKYKHHIFYAPTWPIFIVPPSVTLVVIEDHFLHFISCRYPLIWLWDKDPLCIHSWLWSKFEGIHYVFLLWPWILLSYITWIHCVHFSWPWTFIIILYSMDLQCAWIGSQASIIVEHGYAQLGKRILLLDFFYNCCSWINCLVTFI